MTIEMKTGDIVKIEGGYFKADNGTFLVKHSPGDPSWSGSDYSLTKCNKKGIESESKYSTAFWPLMITVNNDQKRREARAHNAEHAAIEVIGAVKVYELIVKQSRGWNDYETREIATEKRYQELLANKYNKVEIISESTNEQKAELTVPVFVEEVATVEVEKVVEVTPTKPMTVIAYELGVQAFNSGKRAIPAHDKEFLETCLTGCKVGEGAPYIEAWSKGWHESNLKAEVVEEPKPSIALVEAITPTTTIQSPSLINEALAKRSKENMSFSDYRPGSATAEFNSEIATVAKLVEEAKLNVSDEAKAKLDRFLESYTAKYASWTNRRNASGSRHVSVMIAGPSNYNMRAHERYLSRESKLWEEYDEFKNPEWKISSIVAGDKIIKSNDSNAIDKLKEKLANALEEHAGYKEFNVQARKDGTRPHAAYVLQNSNGRIKGIKDRIASLERAQARGTKEIVVETQSEENGGIRIVDNVEAHRLQIFFNGKPSAEVRTQLKKNGFRWTPSIEAWQSYRSDHASRAAQQIVSGM